MNGKLKTSAAFAATASDTLAWNEGYRAEKQGKPSKANPYRDGYVDKSFWQMGWEAARRDSNREP
jgi:ribosome modulation factor